MQDRRQMKYKGNKCINTAGNTGKIRLLETRNKKFNKLKQKHTTH